MRPFWSFVTPIRVFRMVRAKFHKHKHNTQAESDNQEISKADNRKLTVKSFFRKSPWKMDFSQAKGNQLVASMKRIKSLDIHDRDQVDVVLIGHSKTFFHYNEKSLSRFLKWTKKQPEIR